MTALTEIPQFCLPALMVLFSVGVNRGEIVAAAMIDRLVHHAEVVTLAGDSTAPAAAARCSSSNPDRPGAN